MPSILSLMPPALERTGHQAAIESCTLLDALTAAERESLVDRTFLAFADRGETIWLAGAPSEFCAVVPIGFVKMTRSTPSGQEVAVDLLGPGQAYGILVALEGKPFPLSAIAVTSCWYLKLPTRVLQEIYEKRPALKDRIVRSLSPRQMRAHSMMARLSAGSAEERIAAVLLILSESFGIVKGSRVRITVPLTRQVIGEMAGTTVETTIRVMSRWQKDGVLRTEHQVLTISDASKVEKILESN